MTNTELIALTIAASLRKDWSAYAELKIEFFARLQSNPSLAAEAERAAHWAGLFTF
jgi:hypothetical protein